MSITVVDHLDSLFALMRAGLAVVGRPIERVLPDWDVIHRYEATTGVYALFSGGKSVSAKVRAFVDLLVERMAARFERSGYVEALRSRITVGSS